MIGLIVFFFFLSLFFLYLRLRQVPVTVRGLLQATGFVLGLTFVYIFLILAAEELGLKVNADEIMSGIVVLILIIWGYRRISKNLSKYPEIQLDIFLSFD